MKVDPARQTFVPRLLTVLQDSRLDPVARLLLIHFHYRGSPTERSWWSDERTAGAVGVSVRTMRRARDRLRAAGYITTVRTGRSLSIWVVEKSLQSEVATGPLALKMADQTGQIDRSDRPFGAQTPLPSLEEIEKERYQGNHQRGGQQNDGNLSAANSHRPAKTHPRQLAQRDERLAERFAELSGFRRSG